MSKPDDNQHKYTKDKGGFKIETTDPIQDIMSDEELKEAENTLFNLIEADEPSTDKENNKLQK